MNSLLAEKQAVKKIIAPGADVNGGVNGERIDMSEGFSCAAIIQCDNAASDLTISLRQHDAPTGGNSKDLSIDSVYLVQTGGSGAYSKKSIVGNQIVEADVNGAEGIIIVEVQQDDLDANGGFKYFSVDISSAAIKLCDGKYHLEAVRKKPAHELSV